MILAQAFFAVLVVAALARVAWAIGAALTRPLGLGDSPERAVAATALGLGVLSHFIFAVGAGGRALGRWLPLTLLALALLLSLPALRAARRAPVAAWLRRRVVWLLAAFAVVLVLVLVALLPPTAWDATMYHLAYAKAYARMHQVTPVAQVRYPVFPQLNEMLFTAVYILGGEVGPPLVELLLAVLTAAGLYAWGTRLGSRRAGVSAAALWLANPHVLFLATSAYIDIGLCCFVTLAVLAAGNGWRDGHAGWWAIAGALAGFGADCKYLGLPFLAGVGAAALVDGLRRRRRQGPLGCALAGAAAALPWYLYNFVFTGNPVFPFAGALFGYGPWNAGDLALQMAEMRSHGYGRGLGALLLLPWNLTVHQPRFNMEAPFLPLFLPALALTAWAAWRDRAVRALLGVVLVYGLFWFASMQLLRYLVCASALFSLALALAGERALEWMHARRGWRPSPRLQAGALALLGATALVYLGTCLDDGLPLTAAARDAYLERKLPAYRALARLNRTRGRDYRAYGIDTERMAYFADGLLLGDVFGSARYRDTVPLLGDPPALAAHLQALGAEYLLLPRAYLGPQAWQAPAFAARFDLVDASPAFTLLRRR